MQVVEAMWALAAAKLSGFTPHAVWTDGLVGLVQGWTAGYGSMHHRARQLAEERGQRKERCQG